MAQAIQDARYELVTHQTDTIYKLFDGGYYVIIPYIISISALVIGVVYFKNQSKYFAEDL